MYIKFMFILVSCHLINGTQNLQCGDFEPYKDETCFKVFDNKYVQNYADARNACFQYNGSSILSIHSQEEQDFFLNQIYNIHKIVNEVWIGAEYKNKILSWSDNSITNYTNWANGYPKDNSDYQCVSIGFEEPNHGKWVNDPCEKINSVVCQMKQNWSLLYLQNTVMEIRENFSKSSIDTRRDLLNAKSELDYYKTELKHVLQNASTGCSLSENWIKCEVFIDFRTNQRQVIAIPKALNEKFLNRDNALNVCKKYNATLISIESIEKQSFIETFVQSNGTNIWTSGYSSSVDKKWRWINGNELTYTHWHTGKPKNGYPVEPCLELSNDDGLIPFNNYLWNDLSCVYERLVLCEFDITN